MIKTTFLLTQLAFQPSLTNTRRPVFGQDDNTLSNGDYSEGPGRFNCDNKCIGLCFECNSEKARGRTLERTLQILLKFVKAHKVFPPLFSIEYLVGLVAAKKQTEDLAKKPDGAP